MAGFLVFLGIIAGIFVVLFLLWPKKHRDAQDGMKDESTGYWPFQ